MARELEAYQLVERSLIKKFRKEIWNPFIEAVKNYNFISENDVINVEVENNAKSLLSAMLLKQLGRVSEIPFKIEFVDKSSAGLCEKFHIDTVDEFSEKGKLINTITYSDVVRKALKSIVFEHGASSILPAEKNTINPLYCIADEAVSAWVKYNNIDFPIIESSTDDIEIDNLLKRLGSDVEHSIFKSTHAVCLDTIPAYIKDNTKHSYLEKY